jgi:hypothetical protein
LRLRRTNLSSLLGGTLVAVPGALLVGFSVVADARWFDEHWLELYCAVSPSTKVWETLARTVAAIVGLGLILASLSIVPRWIAMRNPVRSIRSLAAIAVAVALALVTSDAVLRWRARKKNSLAEDPKLPPMMIDTSGNYAPVPGTKEVTLPTGRVEYAIDADGNRSASADRVTDTRAPTVLFAGESITLGWGVPYEKTYPALVGAALGVQAIDLGVTGFSNDQAYLRLRAALDKLSRPVAVVMIAIAQQLERNVSPRRDRLVLSSQRLSLLPASTSWVATSPLRDLLGYHSYEAIPLTHAILRATAEEATAKGARPIFVWTNFGPPCLGDESGVSPLERSLFDGIAHLRVEITPDQRLGGWDLHPNEAGHIALAGAVVAALRQTETVFR